MRIVFFLFAFCLSLYSEERVVYQYRDADLLWEWSLNPGQLTTGMETELVIKAKVIDGVNINVTGELKGGGFRLRQVEHLPLRWEKPYWVHEMKALLATRLPGEYILPQHTVYLQKGAESRTVTSARTLIEVRSLMSVKEVEKKDLKDVVLKKEVQPKTSTMGLILAIVIGLFSAWKLLQLSKAPQKQEEPKVKIFEPFEYWVEKLTHQKEVSERFVLELSEKLDFCFKNAPAPQQWGELAKRWELLRFAKTKQVEEWLTFCRDCAEVERSSS